MISFYKRFNNTKTPKLTLNSTKLWIRKSIRNEESNSNDRSMIIDSILRGLNKTLAIKQCVRLFQSFLPIFLTLFLFINLTLLFSENLEFSTPKNCETLNSPEDDFAPSWNIYLNQLYFNSSREGYSMFYTARRSDSINFDNPKLIMSEINQSRNNQSYITFINRDEALFSTFRQTSTQSFLNIFKTVYIRQGWSEPIKNESLFDDSFSAQPAVSPDGSTLVFSSDRQSPFKDTDLWISYRQNDGSWGTPVPIDELNSRGNEITPFLKSSDSLFFATDGQEGPGGYDVFYSIKVKGRWSPPRPLQSINTPFDESDLIILPDGNALFASNIPGGKGKLDLYIAEPLVKSNGNNEQETLELSIRTQSVSVEIQKNKRYIDMPMPVNLPLGYFDKYENEEIIPGLSLGEYIRVSFDSLISRLKQSADRVITIELGDSTSLQLLRLFGFNSKAVEYKFGNSDGIIIKSKDPAILAPVRFVRDSFSINPPALEIELDARPRGKAASWTSSLIIGKDTIPAGIKLKTLPNRFLFDLIKIEKIIDNADSLIINFTIINNDASVNQTSKVINLYRSSTESRVKKSTGGEESDLFLFGRNEIFSADNFSAKFSDMISASRFSRVTELICGSENDKQMAELLKSIILKSNRGINIKILVERSSISLQDWFSRNFILVRCKR